MNPHMQGLVNDAHTLLRTTRLLPQSSLRRYLPYGKLYAKLVEDLEVWIYEWLQRVYTSGAADTPSIPATISEDEYHMD